MSSVSICPNFGWWKEALCQTADRKNLQNGKQGSILLLVFKFGSIPYFKLFGGTVSELSVAGKTSDIQNVSVRGPSSAEYNKQHVQIRNK